MISIFSSRHLTWFFTFGVKLPETKISISSGLHPQSFGDAIGRVVLHERRGTEMEEVGERGGDEEGGEEGWE